MEMKDFLGIGTIIILGYLIFKSISKWITELRWKRQINQKPKYKTKEEILKEQEEIKRQIVINRNEFYKKIFEGKEFINKNTDSLSKFIINSNINKYDIHKLAQLNEIKVEMHSGWNDLVLQLMIELDKTGWNRKVASIKQKFGELRFYAETEHTDILEKYIEKSLNVCEICGKKGKHFVAENGWQYTRCSEH